MFNEENTSVKKYSTPMIILIVILGGIFAIMDTLTIILTLGALIFNLWIGLVLSLLIVLGHIYILRQKNTVKQIWLKLAGLHIILFAFAITSNVFFSGPMAERTLDKMIRPPVPHHIHHHFIQQPIPHS